MQFIGRSGNQVLFSIEDKAILIDESKKLVLAIDQAEPLVASFTPEGDQTNPESVPYELAVAAATDLDIKVFSNNDRLYTIPKSVVAEAKRGLEWRKEEKRGGTAVGLNTARTLARGGQIGIRKIRHIAKYFPRHEVDKKGTGYQPGEKNYPSNGRIAWALWGGDSANSWANTIVNRENKKAQQNSITASYNFVMSEYENPEQAQLSSFIEAESLPENLAPEFFIRVRLDGTGIDRLYKTNSDGTVYVWDDAMWEDLGNINHDFETYDRSLDEPYDTCPKIHIPVDVETAIAVSGLFDGNPEKTVSMEKINPSESRLFLDEMDGVDWELVDSVSYDYEDEYPKYAEYMDFIEGPVVAAGEGGLDSTKPADGPTNRDGNYTPDERSKLASSQVRDKSGMFAKSGGKVVIGGNPAYTGTIQSVNPANQTVKVKLANGNDIDVPANTTESLDTFKPIPMRSTRTPRNLTQGILGEPRVPIDSASVTLPDRLPQIGSSKAQILTEDYSPWVTDARSSNLTAPKTPAQAPAPTSSGDAVQDAIQKATNELLGYKSANAYNDPLLRDFLQKTVKRPDGSTYSPNARFFMPSLRNEQNVEAYKSKPAADVESDDPDWMNKAPNAPYAPPSSSKAKTTTTPAVSAKQGTTTTKPAANNGVTPGGTKNAPTYTKNINGYPVQTDKDGTPIKGTYVDVPATGYKTGGKTPTTIYPGESVGSINDKGEIGTVVNKFTDDAGKETTEYKGADGSKWFGQRGTVVPKGFKLYEDGSIGPNDPKNPPKGSYDSSKTGPNGQVGKAVETFTDSVTNRVRTKYSDGKSTWYGEKDTVVAPGFTMQEDGSWARNTKGVNASGFVASVEGEVELTPETSDVPPIYMAIVSPDDPQAVMDLVSLIPASSESTEPMTYIRKPGVWEKDETVLNDIKSPTPPPMVVLDDEVLAVVMSQIDAAATTASGYSFELAVLALMAAGGADKNRGNAEELRRYWLYGRGAAKIRWNTPGDWTRCVRQLSKYMGPRSKGYCALRHKEATGLWTGDKEHRQKYGRKGMKADAFSSDFIIPSNAVIAQSLIKAQMAEAKSRVYGLTADASEESTNGAEFFIPLVIPEGIESGDGRKFNKGSITMRELPLPLLWQIKTGEGHSGSVVVGKITKMLRTDEGIGNASGFFDSGEYGKEAERLVRGGFIRGVSADMDMFEAKEDEEASKEDSDSKVGGGKMNISKARVMAVTLVPKPAFQECKITLTDPAAEQEEKQVIQDGVYVDGVNPLDASALVACGIVAGAIPVTPPKEWFDNQKLKKPTALTVTDEGQVFGHIAAWHVDHIGMAFGTKPPRSKSNYAYFHTGVVRTLENTDVPVGQLTLAGGHATLEASASEAVRHYDDTASAIADVHAGEDAYGIWVAGALRPGTTPEQIRSLRASAPSGDWRPIKGSLELVAVCQVNVPGFPIARARVASGQVMALVAAGASVLAQLKSDPLRELNERVGKLEAPVVAAAQDARSRMVAMTAAIKAEELSSRFRKMRDEDVAYMQQTFDDTESELAVISREKRMKLADEGRALPDGSFPIRNIGDLKNAVHAYGRSKPGKRGLVRRHIMKMARMLERDDIIPDTWTKGGTTASATSEIVETQIAAGGLDRNRGNAERLRRYWTRGEGAAKIRWGQSGDWKRCVKYLSKYLGTRSKGYCQLRHKEALGFYTSTHAKMDKERKSFAEIDELLGTFTTQVTEEDMAKDVNEIIVEPDNSHDGNWEPEEEIIILLVEGNDLDEASFSEFSAFDFAETEFIDATEPLDGMTPQELDALKKVAKSEQMNDETRAKYVPGKTQPRDASGKFRQVLARLKTNLGVSGSDNVIQKIEEAENLDNAGNYAGAAKAAGDLLSIIDRLDSNALNPDSLENIRTSAGELGKVIANLPFAFGADAEKIRFSDIPPALKSLMEDMIKRVEEKIGKEDADIATKDLKSFMAGGDYYNQSEISSHMSKLLRLLT